MAKTEIIDTVEMDTIKSTTQETLDGSLCQILDVCEKSTGRYKFIRSIGFGGMKAVLLVQDMDTGREVAMAMMPDAKNRPKQDVENFIYEAKLSALLEHPNIVPIYDIGVDLSGSPFYIMKYLRGQTLSSVLRQVRDKDEKMERKYKLKEALRIFVRVCSAIDFAHSKGILHLDIKPENIAVGAYGEVIVLDWGLAVTTKDSTLQNSGNRKGKGTPGFMSPEQILGEYDKLDSRSDIYGLGALLYTMLSFTRPLAGLSLEETVEAVCSGNIKPPNEVALHPRYVPEALNAVCMKAMATDPNERYESVAQLRAEIQNFRYGYATDAQQASTLTKTALFVNRNYWGTLLASIIVILLAIIAYLLNYISIDI